MIEISLGKLLLLALVALLVLGPEKLPGAARTAGALVRRLRNGWESVRAEVERELEVEDIRRAAREAASRAEAAQAEFKESMRQVEQPVSDAVTEIKTTVTAHGEAAQAEFMAHAQEVRQPVAEAVNGIHAADAAPAHESAASTYEPQQELPLGEPSAAPSAKESTRDRA